MILLNPSIDENGKFFVIPALILAIIFSLENNLVYLLLDILYILVVGLNFGANQIIIPRFENKVKPYSKDDYIEILGEKAEWFYTLEHLGGLTGIIGMIVTSILGLNTVATTTNLALSATITVLITLQAFYMVTRISRDYLAKVLRT